MINKVSVIVLLIVLSTSLYAQSYQTGQKNKIDYLPLVFYNSLSLEKQNLNTYGAGFALMSGDMEAERQDETDNFQTIMIYSRSQLGKKALLDYPENYNNIEFLMQRKKQKHQYFSLLKSYSDIPVAGGMGTFAFVTGYGYEMIHSGGHSLYLGGSIAVSDWGIEMGNGSSWPVIPIPFLHYEYSSPWFFSSFDFTTSPMLELVLAPEKRFRLNISLLAADLESWQESGIKYDLNFEYRFFSKDHEMGDFAGIKAGFMAEDYSCDLSGQDDESIQVGWKTVYAALDLSLLEVSSGYAMGTTYYSNGTERDLGDGFFFNIQMVYLF